MVWPFKKSPLIILPFLPQIKDQGCTAIADGIAPLQELISLTLELRDVQMRDNGCVALANAFERMRGLRKLKLDFGENDFGDRGGLALAGAFGVYISSIFWCNL